MKVVGRVLLSTAVPLAGALLAVPTAMAFTPTSITACVHITGGAGARGSVRIIGTNPQIAWDGGTRAAWMRHQRARDHLDERRGWPRRTDGRDRTPGPLRPYWRCGPAGSDRAGWRDWCGWCAGRYGRERC